MGDSITVLEVSEHPKNGKSLRCSRGWVSLQDEKGKTSLKLVEGSGGEKEGIRDSLRGSLSSIAATSGKNTRDLSITGMYIQLTDISVCHFFSDCATDEREEEAAVEATVSQPAETIWPSGIGGSSGQGKHTDTARDCRSAELGRRGAGRSRDRLTQIPLISEGRRWQLVERENVCCPETTTVLNHKFFACTIRYTTVSH